MHSTENFELEVVFVLDFTNSMAAARLPDGRTGVQAMLEAFDLALAGLPSSHRVGVVEFHDRNTGPGILSSLTADRTSLIEAVRAFEESGFVPGSSRVWDSVQTAASLFTKPADTPNVVRALVFISDGRDTSSIRGRGDAGETATEDEIQLYAVGVGEVFEEQQLAQMVLDTGGFYYAVRELGALQEQLQVLVSDLRGQYRLTYITLRRRGEYQTRVEFDLPWATGSFETDGIEVSEFYGPDSVGRIAIDPPSEDKETGTAQVFIRALHMPSNISRIRLRLDTLKPLEIATVPKVEGGLLQGWSLTGPDSEGFYEANGNRPVEFGNFGLLFRVKLSGITERSTEIPATVDNSIYTAAQSFTYPEVFYIGEPLPGSGRIVFRTTRDGNREIYVVNFDGTDERNLTDHFDQDYQPTWSPDGGQIAFDSNRVVRRQVFVMNADWSGAPRLITPLSSSNSLPAWSFDGSRIVFVSDRDGNRDIYVMDSDGGNLIRVTAHTASDWWASWSPDGSRIVFTSNRDGIAEVYVIVIGEDLTGGRNLTNNPAGDYRPVWSPDGKRIAFYSWRDGNREVYVMNADGKQLRNITNHPADDWYPAWSPDGLRIAFTTLRDGNREVYVMDSDGNRPRNVSEPSWGGLGPLLGPSWGPVSSALARWSPG